MFTTVFILKLFSIVSIFLMSALAGIYPFFKRWKKDISESPIGEALAAGVFLGAGLIHMLSQSTQSFHAMAIQYPLAFFLAGITFLFFLALEHIGRELYEHDGPSANGFAIVAFVMLSVHSFLEGAALGLNHHIDIVIVLLAAILAHKWAASFALANQLTKSHLPVKIALLLFIIFTLMTPLGIVFGGAISAGITHAPILEPVFNSIAAGTFLYLGTLHGLRRSVMVEKCCNLKNFFFVIMGFSIMAIAAIWA